MQTISKKQTACVFITFLISSIPMISGYNQAKQDIWISYLLAFAAILPLVLLYVRMCSLFPGKNLFEIFGEVFGRIPGVVLSFIYILYILNIAGLSLRVSSEFIRVISLTETPEWITLIFFFFLCAYGAWKGYEGVGRFSALFLPLMLLLLVCFFLFSVNMYDWTNIEPVRAESLPQIADSSMTIFVYPFGELLVSFFFFSDMKQKKGKGYLPYAILLSVSAVTLVMTVLNNILILGAPSMTKLYYPTYMANSMINLGVISGIEIISSAIFFMANIVKCIVCLLAAAKGVYYIVPNAKKANPSVLTFFCAVCCLFGGLVFKSTMQLFDFFYLYRLYGAVLQLFPLTVWVGAEIKSKIAKNNRLNPGQLLNREK